MTLALITAGGCVVTPAEVEACAVTELELLSAAADVGCYVAATAVIEPASIGSVLFSFN